MDGIFKFYINSMPITFFFVLGALIFHFLLRKRPGSQLYLIWVFVLIRLLAPFSVDTGSEFGAYTLPKEVTEIMSGFNNSLPPDEAAVDKAVMDEASVDAEVKNVKGKDEAAMAASPKGSAAGNVNGAGYYRVFQTVWLIGIIGFAAYYLMKMLLLNRKIKSSIKLEEYKNVWMWNDNTGACVIGLFRPRIYVPLGCGGKSLEIIVRHEAQHIKHLDYWFVFLFYAALALNWYNPLAWIAYKMAVQDVEKACDERVLRGSTVDERKEYARTLLGLFKAASSKTAALGFGTAGIKKRIKNIGENRPRKVIYTVLIVLVLCPFMAVCSVLHAKTDEQKTDYNNTFNTIDKEESKADRVNVNADYLPAEDIKETVLVDENGRIPYSSVTKEYGCSDVQNIGKFRASSSKAYLSFGASEDGAAAIKLHTESFTGAVYKTFFPPEAGTTAAMSGTNFPVTKGTEYYITVEPINDYIYTKGRFTITYY